MFESNWITIVVGWRRKKVVFIIVIAANEIPYGTYFCTYDHLTQRQLVL